MESNPEMGDKSLVLITGVGSGIGHQLVIRFLKGGYSVVALGRNSIQPNFGLDVTEMKRLKYLPFDYANYDLLVHSLQSFVKLGSVGILINNAGTLINKTADDTTEEDLLGSYRVNAIVPFMLTKSLKQAGFFKRNAHVVNVSSMAGIVGGGKYPGLLAYSSSKASLNAITESMQVEWGDSLTINALALGAVNTQMFREAFFDGQTEISDVQMADWIFDFALKSGQIMGGQVLQVKKSDPF